MSDTPTLTFLGATGTGAGSKGLLEINRGRLLTNCGLFQGKKALWQRNWQTLPVEAASLDAILPTHAHLDHGGYLPVLHKQGCSGPVYCTSGSAALARIRLPDGGHRHKEDARYVERIGYSNRRPARPLQMLRGVVNQTTMRDGVLMFPAVAVARAETILHLLATLHAAGKFPKIPVCLNNRMAINATDIFCNHAGKHRLTPAGDRGMCGVATYPNSSDESRVLNRRGGPMTVTKASGGRILHHFKAWLDNAGRWLKRQRRSSQRWSASSAGMRGRWWMSLPASCKRIRASTDRSSLKQIRCLHVRIVAPT